MLAFNLINIMCNETGMHEITMYDASVNDMHDDKDFITRGVGYLKSCLKYPHFDGTKHVINHDYCINYVDNEKCITYNMLDKFRMSNYFKCNHNLLMIDMRVNDKTITPTFISFETKKGEIVAIDIVSKKQNFIVLNLKTREYKSQYPIKVDWYETENC